MDTATTTTRHATCTLCDANCGLSVTVDDGRVLSVRGDQDDPFSRGHICPKATAIPDLMADPDRVRSPLRRVAGADGYHFEPVTWEAALADIGERLREIRRTHGDDAIGTYQGNPTAHDHGAGMAMTTLRQVLGGRNHFSAVSVDNLPRMVASNILYGSPAATPVPDLDRCDLLLMIGANPLVSNGSGMVSPDVAKRLEAIRARGAVIVVDPRRTETARKSDAHHFIRPGTDALFLLSLLHELLQGSELGPWAKGSPSLATLRDHVAEFSPERTVQVTGVPAEDVRDLAARLTQAERPAVYGRMGTCVQEHGTATTLLLDITNAVLGSLDRVGGVMFNHPAFDVPRLTAMLPKKQRTVGGFRSRVRGLPGFLGELPVAAMAEEIETGGVGQLRAMIVHAGNPVLSNPGSGRLESAFETLDLLVSVDLYVNETSRLAHYILPTPVGFERSHYPFLFAMQGVRNFAAYHPPLLSPPPGTREGFEVLLRIAEEVARGRPLGRFVAAALAGMRSTGADALLDLLLRAGPRRLSLKRLAAEGHTMDLGALEPRLVEILKWTNKGSLDVFPSELRSAMPALRAMLTGPSEARQGHDLVLISRRTLRSNNSWMNNSPRLMKGKTRCTLEMHPADAEARGIADGATASLTSDEGRVEVPVRVSDAIMRGVVCLPHGWGHGRKGVRLRVASDKPGESVNDLIAPSRVDALSGTSALSGQPVSVALA